MFSSHLWKFRPQLWPGGDTRQLPRMGREAARLMPFAQIHTPHMQPGVISAHAFMIQSLPNKFQNFDMKRPQVLGFDVTTSTKVSTKTEVVFEKQMQCGPSLRKGSKMYIINC